RPPGPSPSLLCCSRSIREASKRLRAKEGPSFRDLEFEDISCVSWSCQHSRQGLQIRQGHAVAHRAILISSVGLGIRCLRVPHFQMGRVKVPMTEEPKLETPLGAFTANCGASIPYQ